MTPDQSKLTRRTFGVGAAALGAAALFTPAQARAEGAAAAQVPAFPGAEGCGMYVSGGRGGDVYPVTTLADSGPGSLREAVKGSNRTVVFKVSGTIYLKSRLDISGSNLTVAGQTAPGDGICIAGYPTRIAGQNVIVRYLRCRMGDIAGVTEDAMWARRTQDVIIDHCSLSWSTDEALSVYENARVTVQWCLLSESLTMSVNPEGRHGYGGIWGGENVSYHHNLIVHHTSRTPRFAPRSAAGPDIALKVDYRNNVVYNWGFNSAYGGEDSAGINMVGNYYRSGPDTLAEVRDRIVEPTVSTLGGPGSWYVADNHVDGFPQVTADNWLGVDGDVAITRLTAPVTFPQELPAESAVVAFERVLAGAGAILPRRDSVDARVVQDVRQGTGRLINSQTEVGGWPELRSTTPPADSDGDGIPDAWETANGLNPQDPADGKAVGADGYTNLERYLNSIGRTGAANPDVRLLQPTGDALVTTSGATAKVLLVAEAAGRGVPLARVEFRAGDKLVGTVTSRPYRLEWKDAPEGTHYATATAVDATGTATTSTALPVHVNRATTIGEWKAVDVGSTPIRGAASLVDGVMTVKGSGAIGGTADRFRFVFRPWRGDGEIVARVESIRKVYPEVVGGVMIRSNLGPSASFALMQLTYFGSGMVSRFGTRVSDGAEAQTLQYPDVPEDASVATPYWVRLTRKGGTVTGAVSADAQTWHEVGSGAVELPELIFVGLAVDGRKESNAIANYGTVRFSGISLG
ncbi:Ig-like domain-containing protein [Nonomuraea aridisoli]|uniref:Pectate lyase n=1 Tax=Nonomuraea aridisoli TaxID=2070368 RepID=A0A2W2F602_9ACTN|nr:Ig-like domain-containing protein [Nonomuraea aridisoli]PZG20498.1 hypothetical protein C1J01_09135 [Nonomuraea aridisoli]